MNKENGLSLIRFFLDQITKIKICHMVASKYPELIEGTKHLIYMNVFGLDEADEGGVVDYDAPDLYGEGEIGYGESGVSKSETE